MQAAQRLLASISAAHVVGLRDRALIATLVYIFGRVGAVVRMNVEDYYPNGKRWFLRRHKKGGKHHEVPAHQNAEAYLDVYLRTTGLEDQKKEPLFRSTVRQSKVLTDRRLHRSNV